MAPQVDTRWASLLIQSIHSGRIRSSGRGDSASPCLRSALDHFHCEARSTNKSAS